MNPVLVLRGEEGVVEKDSLTDMGEEKGLGNTRKRPNEKDSQIRSERCRQKLGEEGRS